MSAFQIIISPEALSHIQKFKKSGQKILLQRIENIILELENSPYEGIGKPEKLKYFSENVWSRRIDSKHRLVYEVIEDEVLVEVISAHGHYSDK